MSTTPVRFQRRIVSTLSAWPFLLSLAVLVVNDTYLKAEFPGWLTGKLSDFSGIYLFAFLAFSLAPRSRPLVAVIIAVAFLYWKSPASQWFIDSINTLSRIQFGRVVDYSDLIALVSVPGAWATISREHLNDRWLSLQKLLSIPVAVLTMLAITGTSVLWPAGEYSIRNTDENNRIEEAEIVLAIERVMTRYDLQCENCRADVDETKYSNEDMFFSYSLDEANNGIRFNLRVRKMTGLIMRQPDYDLFDKFMRSLKLEMGELSPSMEFVQNLSGPNHNY